MTAQYERARNPVWANAEQSLITLEVDFSFITDEWVPFTASPDDGTDYGPELFARAVAGHFGEIGAFVPPPEPEPVLSPISALQLSTALFNARKITAAEARAFGRAGVIPASIETAVIAALEQVGKTPDEIQIALLFLESATEYHRDHPLTPIIGLALDMDADALDALWLAGLQIY
jgi:hypothetical protein